VLTLDEARCTVNVAKLLEQFLNDAAYTADVLALDVLKEFPYLCKKGAHVGALL